MSRPKLETEGAFGEIEVGEFLTKELHITNRILNRFLEAFSINLHQYLMSGSKPSREVRNYHYLSVRGQKVLLELKAELQAFKHDFYRLKSAQEIANTIYVDSSTVLSYLKKYKMVAGLEFVPSKTLNLQTEVRGISSFQILRDIQKDQQLKRLQEYKNK